MSADLFQRLLDEMTPEEIAALPTSADLRAEGIMAWDDLTPPAASGEDGK